MVVGHCDRGILERVDTTGAYLVYGDYSPGCYLNEHFGAVAFFLIHGWYEKSGTVPFAIFRRPRWFEFVMQ